MLCSFTSQLPHGTMLSNGCEEFDVNDEKFSNGFEELLESSEGGVSGD